MLGPELFGKEPYGPPERILLSGQAPLLHLPLQSSLRPCPAHLVGKTLWQPTTLLQLGQGWRRARPVAKLQKETKGRNAVPAPLLLVPVCAPREPSRHHGEFSSSCSAFAFYTVQGYLAAMI